jgi:hypothetical protein
MNEPLVSVVMVVCDVERFLAQSIESVLGQSFRDFEFIIVDFGSKDASRSIISNYATTDSRIKLHEIPNCVLPAARNAACSLAQGRYIAVMDADDVCLPDRLRLELEFMEEHPEVGLVGGAVVWVDAADRKLEQHANPSEDHEIRSAMAERCPFWHPTVLLRREAFTLVGGYRTAFVFAHDYDLELRIAERFKCANLKQVVLNYRIHPYQVTVRKKAQQTLCFLAAQVAASSRRNGCPDPLNGVEEITPGVLAGLGVTKGALQNGLASDYRDWIRVMSDAGEFSAALKATVESLQSSDWQCAEKWRIADLWLTAARLHWRQKAFLTSLLALGHAVVIRPVVAGRPLKPLLRRLGLIRLHLGFGKR